MLLIRLSPTRILILDEYWILIPLATIYLIVQVRLAYKRKRKLEAEKL